MKRIVALLLSLLVFLFATAFKSEGSVSFKTKSDTATVSVKADVNILVSHDVEKSTANYENIINSLSTRDSVLEEFIKTSSEYISMCSNTDPPNIYDKYDQYIGLGNTEKTILSKNKVDTIVSITIILATLALVYWLITTGSKLSGLNCLIGLVLWITIIILIMFAEHKALMAIMSPNYNILDEIRRFSG